MAYLVILSDLTDTRSIAYSRVSGVDQLPDSTGVTLPATEHTSRADYSQHTSRADYSQHTSRADYSEHTPRADNSEHTSDACYSEHTEGADYSHLEESVYHSSNEDFLNDSHQSITTHQTGYSEEDDQMSEYHGMCAGRTTIFITELHMLLIVCIESLFRSCISQRTKF